MRSLWYVAEVGIEKDYCRKCIFLYAPQVHEADSKSKEGFSNIIPRFIPTQVCGNKVDRSYTTMMDGLYRICIYCHLLVNKSLVGLGGEHHSLQETMRMNSLNKEHDRLFPHTLIE